MGHVISNKVHDAYFLAEPEELSKVYLKYMDYVTIEKVGVTSDNRITDNNAKINELESLVREMKKKLDKVMDSVWD